MNAKFAKNSFMVGLPKFLWNVRSLSAANCNIGTFLKIGLKHIKKILFKNAITTSVDFFLKFEFQIV